VGAAVPVRELVNVLATLRIRPVRLGSDRDDLGDFVEPAIFLLGELQDLHAHPGR
jgi:hypothetical protein